MTVAPALYWLLRKNTASKIFYAIFSQTWKNRTLFGRDVIKHIWKKVAKCDYNHCHKKRNDNLKTWAVLRACFENQAILELVLPYCLTKCTQTQKQSITTVYEPTFPHFCEIIISFFLFWVNIWSNQDQVVP